MPEQILIQINLPDYKKITSQVKKREVLVSEKEIEESLSWLQKSRAKFSSKTGPSQEGDFVEIEYSSPQLEMGKVFKDALILGQGHFLQDFEKNLEGMSFGEEKEFSFQFPENNPALSQKGSGLAGKKVDFKIEMKSVQKVELPEINDQFAQNLGRFENLMALKQSLKEGLNLEKEKEETQRVRQEILERISQNTTFDIPEILIELEKNRILEDLKKIVLQNLQISFENYLTKINKSEKELLDSLSDQAQKRVKNTLILKEIGKREKIEVSEEEVKNEINKILKNHPSTKIAEKELDPVRNKFLNGVDLEKLKEYTKEVLFNEKTFQFLTSLTQK